MSTVLYRKYRPKRFEELTNQNHVKITLQNEVAQEKISHAYLFSGPRGVGKTSTARILARAINCLNRKKGEGEPCNQCSACLEILSGRSLDIVEIDAASYTGVDMVREVIIDTARFSPARLKYKVFIIDEAHMLSLSAWNALLKILEEPPAHVVFILATTEVHKVPPTILSRCQHFDFKRLSINDLIERLRFLVNQEKKNVSLPVLQSIAHLAEGSIRDAESLLEQILALDEKEINEEKAALVLPRSSFVAVLDFLDLVFKNQPNEALDLLNQYFYDGFDLEKFSKDIIEILREVLVYKVKLEAEKQPSFVFDEDLEEKAKELAKKNSFARIINLLKIFLKYHQELKSSPLPQLPLELAIFEACGLSFDQEIHDFIDKPKKVNETFSEKFANQDEPKNNIQKNFLAEKQSSIDSTKAEDKPEKDKATEITQEKNLEEDTSLSFDQIQENHENINLDFFREKWIKFLEVLKQNYPNLFVLLIQSQPIDFGENALLKIGVRYSFHREKINDLKNRVMLQKVAKEFFGLSSLKLEAVLIEKSQEENILVNEVLKHFGGNVLE